MIRFSIFNENACNFIILFTEVTSPDGGFNDAENGRLPNHAAKYGNPSVNEREGRWSDHETYLAYYFSGRLKQVIKNKTESVYRCFFYH